MIRALELFLVLIEVGVAYSLLGSYLAGTCENLPPLFGNNFGEPLFLTGFIEKGQLEEGRVKSIVPKLKGNCNSHAGFLTVNKVYKSNLFFWYFPAENDPENAPVVLWLQGGPGIPSLYGLFNEIGPFYVKKHRGLKMRDHYWSQALNVIFIDNPVGTGFSFTNSLEGYSRDQTSIGRDLYSALIQFFTLFPNLRDNEFYIVGESYAGKYVPSLGYTIHKNNPSARLRINLQGMAIGNGFCAPEHFLDHGDYLFNIGLIDNNAKYIFKIEQDKIKRLIQMKKWNEAYNSFDEIINPNTTPSLFKNLTDFNFYFNFLRNRGDNAYGDINKYIQKDLLRRSIHVGNLSYNIGKEIETKLKTDIMQSVQPWIEILIENYRMLFYNGQLDIIVAYPMTVKFLQSLKWSGSALYKTAERKPWYVGEDLAGYSKTARGLTEVLVRNAGHMVPMDQPLWALEMIKKFTSKHF